jgi:hypothetical protein
MAYFAEFQRRCCANQRLSTYEWKLLPLRQKATNLSSERRASHLELRELCLEKAPQQMAVRDKAYFYFAERFVGQFAVPLQEARRSSVLRLGLEVTVGPMLLVMVVMVVVN